jgi:hypothetical protein
MSNQPSLFSTIKLIKARHVKIGGRELLVKYKGSVKLQCVDGSLIILKDILYILRLGINLVLVRKLCQVELKGSFNKNYMYFKQGPKTVVTITIINSLYMITHISKKCKDTVFVGVEICETTTLTTIDNESKNKATKEKELE